MKKVIIAWLVTIFVSRANSQTYDWVNSYADNVVTKSYNNSIGVDKNGYIYVTGTSEHYTGGGSGASNTFYLLYKFSPSGALIFKDTLSHIVSASVTDPSGSTYMVGGDKVYKYDSIGIQQWIQSIPGKIFRSITLNKLGGVNIYGWGYIGNNSKSTIAKLNPNGAIAWIRNGDFDAGGSIPDPITSDNYGNCYASRMSGNNGFFVKINSAGTTISTYTISDWPQHIAVANDQAVFVAGEIPNTNNSTSRFVRKYNSNGIQQWDVPFTSNFMEISAIACDMYNNLIITGAYLQNLSTGTVNISCGGVEMFIACLNTAGSILWIKTTSGPAYVNGSSNGMPTANSILVNSLNDLFIAGNINGQHNFDSYLVNADPTYTDLFLCKLFLQGTPTSIIPAKKTENSFVIYPSPTSGLFNIECATENVNVQVTIINIAGQRIYSETNQKVNGPYNKVFDLSALPKGIYFVEVNTGKERTVKKIVLE